VFLSLVQRQHVVTVDPKVARRAIVPIQRMLEMA
jgi:quinolinate synthase